MRTPTRVMPLSAAPPLLWTQHPLTASSVTEFSQDEKEVRVEGYPGLLHSAHNWSWTAESVVLRRRFSLPLASLSGERVSAATRPSALPSALFCPPSVQP